MNPESQKILDTLPATVGDMLRVHGEVFYTWQSEQVQSGGYACEGSDARDRFERCHDAAENGSDGSTHAENIQDFRDYGAELFSEARRRAWRIDLTDDEGAELDAAIDARESEFADDCDALEAWHENNGSLEQACG